MSEMGPTPNVCCLASLCSPLTSCVGLSKATVWQNIIRRKKINNFFFFFLFFIATQKTLIAKQDIHYLQYYLRYISYTTLLP